MNGIQMYELSTPSSSEYNTYVHIVLIHYLYPYLLSFTYYTVVIYRWTKHISESAKALPRSGTVEEGPPPPLPANPPPSM